jgi:flagellar assembly protein FliH
MSLIPSGRLLKAHAVRELGQREAFNFSDLERQGVDYLAKVQADASQLQAQAKQLAESERNRIFEEARQAGEQAGLAKAHEIIAKQASEEAARLAQTRFATLTPVIEAVTKAIAADRDQWLHHWEKSAVSLAVTIAEKLIRSALKTHPERAAPMIAEALKLAAGSPSIKIWLSPGDMAHLGDDAPQMVRSICHVQEVTLLQDDQLSPGGCRIETQHGEVDARLETMLERMTAELLT